MDLADAASVRAFLRDARPHWIVSAGAYTAVDKAESEPDLAFAINAEAVGIIGAEARTLGAGVLHFSTDYVFHGEGTRPYLESDPTGPLGVYGASKLAGEQRLLESGATALIFRTSWVYGATGKNFLRTILRLAREAVHQLQQREPAAALARITGIPTTEYPTPAARPANSRLNCQKLAATFDWEMPVWE